MAVAVRPSLSMASQLAFPAVIRTLRMNDPSPKDDGVGSAVWRNGQDLMAGASALRDGVERDVARERREVIHFAQVGETDEARSPSRSARQRPGGVVVAEMTLWPQNPVFQEPGICAHVEQA